MKHTMKQSTWDICGESGPGWRTYRYRVRHQDGSMELSRSYQAPADARDALREWAWERNLRPESVDGKASAGVFRPVPSGGGAKT